MTESLPSPPPDYVIRMPAWREATRLIELGLDPSGRPVRLTPETAHTWTTLHHAAETDGVTLQILSGFRSIAHQAGIVRRKLTSGQPLDAILRVSAYPGHSEHHTGRAIDVGTPGCPPFEEAFAATPAFAWLQHHAADFGFTLSYPPGNDAGIVFEPWHWCFHADLRRVNAATGRAPD